MKFPLLLICLVFVLFTNGQEIDSTQDRIYWSKNYTLEWIDFTGIPPQTETSAALSNIALPYSVQSFSDGKVVVNINTCFIKSKSWVIPKHKNNLLLQHEQLHFDIAELNRRKIVKAISEADVNEENVELVMNTILKQYWAGDYKEMQEKYDQESNFSRFIKKQIEWNKYIAEELEKYNDSRFTEITINVKQD